MRPAYLSAHFFLGLSLSTGHLPPQKSLVSTSLGHHSGQVRTSLWKLGLSNFKLSAAGAAGWCGARVRQPPVDGLSVGASELEWWLESSHRPAASRNVSALPKTFPGPGPPFQVLSKSSLSVSHLSTWLPCGPHASTWALPAAESAAPWRCPGPRGFTVGLNCCLLFLSLCSLQPSQ